MSLYRQYRPQTFADVIGQDHIVSTLEQAIKVDKLAHAYLLAGSRGTGKTTTARLLAKSLLTKGIEDDVLIKQIEKSVEDGSLIDLIEIDAASNRGIDDIRNLVEKIQFSPTVAKAKVYIIDEAHMLTREAFNALLKTLEEPPSYAYFVLATTELFKIPATIQSRCQRFMFRFVSEEDIIRRLQYIADQEKISIERPVLRTIAHSAHGGMRDAISLLDQLRSLPEITIEDVKSRVGETGHEYVEHVLEAIEQGNKPELIALVKRMEEAAIPLDTFCRLLLDAVRAKLHSAVEKNADTTAMVSMLETILEVIRTMRSAPVPGLLLEAALLTLSAPSASPVATSKEPIAPSVAKAAPTPAPQPVAEVVKAPVPTAEPEQKEDRLSESTSELSSQAETEVIDANVEAPDLNLDTIKQAWNTVLAKVTPSSVRMSLKDSAIAKIEGDTLHLTFSSTFHKDKVADVQASRTIEEILEGMFKTPIRIQATVGAKVAPVTDEAAVNLAEAASEIF